MMIGRFSCLAALLFCVPAGHAQLFLNDLPNGDLGRPPQPPFITFEGLLSMGTMATDPSAHGSGPIAEVKLEELRVAQGTVTAEVLHTFDLKYDEQNRLTESSRDGTATVSKYEGSHIVSTESSLMVQGKPVKQWNYWKYDETGKLTDFSRGRSDAIENHYTNFTRDANGRLTGFEYRQGPSDAVSTHTAFAWSSDGRKITQTNYDHNDEFLLSLSEILSDRGEVKQATIIERDWKTKRPKPPVNVSFTYDDRGHLTEQTTEDYVPEDEEQSLPPGKVSITYDDVRHSRTIEYKYKTESVKSTVFLDSTGATVGMSLEVPGNLTDMKLECIFDDHGNWTSCERQVRLGGRPVTTAAWRRSIVYR
jgi:hypothetical protein